MFQVECRHCHRIPFVIAPELPLLADICGDYLAARPCHLAYIQHLCPCQSCRLAPVIDFVGAGRPVWCPLSLRIDRILHRAPLGRRIASR